ncbi:CPBP family intramembrane glutamic endopeptidase [Bacillus sp. FJAT-44742]|uniref:CPBP family intramembrane glutamic endopeptidase n=1 Tax=Bacillus sp. FJAT-44742 TaxID=2014005 RepID=UPI0018E26181|nr:CPBP family intramembrane glutamic endopeptidase [Bacillus sp. FJAT-44742]
MLGTIGCLSLYPVTLTLIEQQLQGLGIDLGGIPIEVVAFLSLINPWILTLIAICIGHFLAERSGLTSFIYNRDVYSIPFWHSFKPTLTIGISSGAAVGGILMLGDLLFKPWLPQSLQPTFEFPGLLHTLSGILYGGIVEEIMMRWGLMTLLVFLLWKIAARKKEGPPTVIYWSAIIISSFVFAIGHYGATLAVAQEMTAVVFLRMMLLNGAGGLVFGWLFWKKGLETAITAHMMTHVTIGVVSFIAAMFIR